MSCVRARSVCAAAFVAQSLMLAFATNVSAQTPAAQSTFSELRADGNGVPVLQRVYRIQFDGSVGAALRTVAQRAGLDVTFDESLPGLSSRVALPSQSTTVARLLLRIVDGTPLSVRVSRTGQIVIVRRAQTATAVGSIRGIVRDANSGEPVGDVRVEVFASRAGTVSHGDGAFLLRGLGEGAHSIRFLRIGYRPQTVDVAVSANSPAPDVVVELDQAAMPLAAVRISPGQFGIMEQSGAAPHTLSREEIRTNPQLGEDVFRAVNKLPGLSANDLSAKFFVRGGSGSELHVSLDGVELYEPFHLKDIDAALSIVDVESIGGIDLSTGGFSAEYGDRLTGVFRMTSIQPPATGSRHAVGLSVTNLRGMSQGGFSGGRGGWVASARRGYLDLALRLTNADDSIKPRYYDAFGKVHFDLTPTQRVAFHALHAGDKMRYLTATDPSVASGYGSSYGWVTWDAGRGTGWTIATVASAGRMTWERRGSQSAPDGQQVLSVSDERSFDVVSVRQDHNLSISENALLRFGGELKQQNAKYDYLSWIRRGLREEGDLVFSFDSTIAQTNPSGTSIGAYVSQRIAVSRIVGEAGIRYDRQTHADGESQLSPRLSVAWNPLKGTTLRAAWGHYYQSHPIFDLQAQDGLDRFSRSERAEHRVIGIEQKLPMGLDGRVELYQRLLSRQRPRFVNALNAIEVFPEVTSDRLLLTPGRGEARGAELLIRPSSRRSLDWSASYALASVTDEISGRSVPRSVDQRHTLSADISYRAASGRWRMSAGWLYHSGWPYTPNHFRMDTVVADSNALLLNISNRLGDLNSGRLPSYYRLDFRATRYMDIKGARVAIFVDLFNALNRQNARGYGYDLRFNPVRIVREIDTQVPRLPTLGVTWEF